MVGGYANTPGTALAVLVWSVCGLLAPSVAPAQPGAPNVVIILADDLGWNDVGYHGSEIRTPNIDQLAAGGVELDRFYAQPSCSPTRAALLTGRSSQSLGVYSPLSKLNPTGLPLTQTLMPEYFREAGYQTFLVGKWHLGFHEPEYRPTSRGFDHFYGHVTGGIGFWDHVHGGGLDWQRNGETLREDGYSTHLFAAEIDRLIEQRDQSKPMFLYAAFNAPHLPNEAPADSIARYSHVEDPNRRVHAAMVSELDTAVGQLLATLEEQGMLDNTLVWFMSDNGGLNPSSWPAGVVNLVSRLEGWLGSPQPFTLLEFARTNVLDGGSDNAPLRKGKQTIYEGGVRVPSAIYWRSKLSPGRSEQMVTVRDVLPTLLAAAGISEPAAEYDGANQWPHLLAGATVPPTDYLVNGTDGEAIYRFPWKLVALNSGDTELYQLDNDPTESVDVSTGHPDMVVELHQALQDYPRGESVHLPIWQAMLDIDFFGGKEDRIPWSEIDSD